MMKDILKYDFINYLRVLNYLWLADIEIIFFRMRMTHFEFELSRSVLKEIWLIQNLSRDPAIEDNKFVQKED